MDLLVIGGDARYAYLAERARQLGLDARAACLERAPNAEKIVHASLEEANESRSIIAPNPFRGAPFPLAERTPRTSELIEAFKACDLTLLADTSGAPEELRALDLSRDECYLRRNARLTAEAALYAAMDARASALCESSCLVVGYGRIGSALTRMLVGLGARVAVCARREVARQQAELDGARAYDISALGALLPLSEVVYTTPPERVFDDALLSAARDALLIDLSSAPYGFDLTRALEIGVDARRESGLPGRYCPRSAGEALLEAALEAMNKHKWGEKHE